jgi:outer membrane receptor protein involved in Fe transport
MKPIQFPPLWLSLLTLTAAGREPITPEPATPPRLADLIVTGKAESLIGEASSASKGQANAKELEERPYLRRGELLEAVPGVVITQHSGDGKANQYFVRGFNLDHGTDFAVAMDGQPVNFVTHAHGQGYADLNPIIPEMVAGLDYWKGPFFAQLGDLSTAGAATFRFFDMLPQGFATVGIGEHNYYRGLLADTIDLAPPILPAGSKSAMPTGERSGLTYAMEYTAGVYVSANHHVNDWFRVQPGLRADAFYFDVESDNPANSGTETDAIVSPKLSLIFGPWADTEFYANAGMGFHSNDARGTTITIDPATGLPADKVDPLVRDNDIEYFYASRLPGEPDEGVEDIHLHPAEPRTFRVSLTRRF